MSKLLLTLVLLVGLVGIAQAEVVFEDDFESYTEGVKPAWYNVVGDVTVKVDDGSVFGYENKYVNITNPGGTRSVLRNGFYSVTDTLATLSFDINQPGLSTGRFVVKCSSGGVTWLRNPSVNVLFNNGVVSAGGQSATYTVDAPHHVDIVVNLTAASGTYYGNTLEYKCYDVWIDYELVLSNVPFHASAAYRIYGIQFEIPDADAGTINLDNIVLHDEAYFSENPLAAGNPVPVSLETGVPLDQTLSWDAGIDIATGGYADVDEYHVYIGGPVTDTSRLTDPNLLNDPNLTVTSAIVYETGSNGGSWTPPAGFLERDITYAWRVDEKLTDGNIMEGYNWAFTTVLSVPVFNTELPTDTIVGLGEYAELTVEATNPFTGDATGLSYQWMYSPDGITFSAVGTSSPILAVAGAQAADQGYYYCDVTIDSNGETQPSRVAYLLVKQALAHWTMDQAHYDASTGVHLDIAGIYNAEPNSAPIFIAGAGPDMPEAGAAVMNPDSFANIGTWNPLETTGQMTLSTWIKWDGTLADEIAAGGKDILSKVDGWGADTMMWAFKIRSVTNDKAGVWFYNQTDAYSIRVSELIPAETWTHVCVAYGSGQAQLYINGKLTATDTNASLGTGTTSNIAIGGAGTSSAFPGAMDEVMIHNYAMDAKDAATLYYQTSKEGVCLENPEFDLNNDCIVDIQDFAIFAASWLDCGLEPVEACFE